MDKILKQYEKLSFPGKQKFDKVKSILRVGKLESLAGQKLRISTLSTILVSIRLSKKERAIILVRRNDISKICFAGQHTDYVHFISRIKKAI